MDTAKRLPPPVATPALRLLERPPRAPRRPQAARPPGFWQRVAEAFGLPR